MVSYPQKEIFFMFKKFNSKTIEITAQDAGLYLVVDSDTKILCKSLEYALKAYDILHDYYTLLGYQVDVILTTKKEKKETKK